MADIILMKFRVRLNQEKRYKYTVYDTVLKKVYKCCYKTSKLPYISR